MDDDNLNVYGEVAKEPMATDQATVDPVENIMGDASQGAQPEAVENVLADDPAGPEGDAGGSGDASGANDPWSQTDKILEGLKDVHVGKDLYGNDVSISAESLRAAIPALKEAGLDVKNTGAVLAAHAAIEGAKLARQNAADRRAINSLARQCRAHFGDDFGRVVANAKRAMRQMDPGLAAGLNATPVLMNDYRFVEFLSNIGSRIGNDDGTSGGSAAPDTKGFDVTSLLPGSNR